MKYLAVIPTKDKMWSLSPSQAATIVTMIQDGEISRQSARELVDHIIENTLYITADKYEVLRFV